MKVREKMPNTTCASVRQFDESQLFRCVFTRGITHNVHATFCPGIDPFYFVCSPVQSCLRRQSRPPGVRTKSGVRLLPDEVDEGDNWKELTPRTTVSSPWKIGMNLSPRRISDWFIGRKRHSTLILHSAFESAIVQKNCGWASKRWFFFLLKEKGWGNPCSRLPAWIKCLQLCRARTGACERNNY